MPEAETMDTPTSIEALYRARTPGSARLAGEAAACFPSGVTHDSRYLKPTASTSITPAGPTSGMSTASATSTTSAGTAPCCWGTIIRR